MTRTTHPPTPSDRDHKAQKPKPASGWREQLRHDHEPSGSFRFPRV